MNRYEDRFVMTRWAGGVLLSVLAGCQGTAQDEAQDAPPQNLVLAGGYRATDDDCRIAGETAFTSTYLDDAADLVACPVNSTAAKSLVDMYGAQQVAQTDGYALFTVPRR